MLDEVHRLLTGNRIFMDRMVGRRRALARGDASATRSPGRCCAPSACGYDVRRAQPVLGLRPRGVRGPDSARTATTTPAISCAWPRWSSRCASPSRRWPRCRAAPINVDFEGRPIDPARLRRPGQAGQDGGPAAGADPLSPNLQGQNRRRCTPRQHARQARRPAAEGDRLRLDRGPDEPLHADHGGLRHPAARRARRTSPVGGRQRRARLLRRLRRQRSAVPRALPAAVPAAGRRAAPDDRGRDGRPTSSRRSARST